MRSRLRPTAWLVCLPVLAALPVSAVAQEDVQAQSVSDRSRPGYSARGIPMGSFTLYPSLEVETEYNDNILYTETNEIDDFIFTVRPQLNARDNRADRQISLQLSGKYDTYVENTDENRLNLSAAADARFGLGTVTRYRASLSFRRTDENRREFYSFTGTREPISYNNFRAMAGVDHDFGPVTLGVDARASAVRYLGSLDYAGQEYDLSFRDSELYEGTARLAYSRSAGQRIYMLATVNKRNRNRYTGDPTGVPESFMLNRSSQGIRLEAGLTKQISELLFLDARAGYFIQDYEDPSIDNQKGLAFDTSVLWNVTPLTSIRVSGSRQIDEFVNPLRNGVVRTQLAGTVDHELLRNLILTFDGYFANLNPIESDPATTLENIDEWGVGLSSRLLFAPRWQAWLGANHYQRSSTATITQNRVSAGVRYSF